MANDIINMKSNNTNINDAKLTRIRHLLNLGEQSKEFMDNIQAQNNEQFDQIQGEISEIKSLITGVLEGSY